MLMVKTKIPVSPKQNGDYDGLLTPYFFARTKRATERSPSGVVRVTK